VSVVAVFNAMEAVSRATIGILNQRLRGFELIIVDNGSTDHTPEVLDSLARRDCRITVLREPKRGIASVLNRGIEAAQGQYIARIDSDDESMTERLEKHVLFLDRNLDIGLVPSRGYLRRKSPIRSRLFCYVKWSNLVCITEGIDLNQFMEAPVAHAIVMFRRRLVASYGSHRQGGFPEDYE